MKIKRNILFFAIFLICVYSCSNRSIKSDCDYVVYDTIKVYDTVEIKYQNLYNCAQISPVKTFGLFVNIEIPMEIYVEGIEDSLLDVTTDNGTIIKKGRFYEIKTEKIGSTIITVTQNGIELIKKSFTALQLPNPEPKLGNFDGKEISKNDLLNIPGLWAKMPSYCDFYSASIKSFCMVFYKNGEVIKLKSENSRFTNEQIDLINKLEAGQSVYFEDIISKTEDGFEHELEIIKVTIK